MVGLTEAEPLEYTYVDAPVGIIINEDPLQMEPELTATVGKLSTETELTTLPKQPDTFEPKIV